MLGVLKVMKVKLMGLLHMIKVKSRNSRFDSLLVRTKWPILPLEVAFSFEF